MRVRVLKTVRAYWNYEVRDFPPESEFDGDLARHLAANAPADTVEVLEADPEPEAKDPDADGGEDGAPAELDIDGTAQAVLAWVGEDPDRAAEALAAEQAKDKPRSTLVKQLEKLADSDEGDE
jgi:hypothetical protein